MPGILVIAETRRGELRDVSLELVGQAVALKDQAHASVSVAVIDPEPGRCAAALSIDGVDEILAVASPVPDFEAHLVQRAVEALIEREQPQVILAAHSIDALGFAPAVAARNGLGFATDVTGLSWDDGPVITRGAYGDKLAAEYDFPGKECTLLLLRVGTFSPALSGSSEVPVRQVDLELRGAIRTEHAGYRESEQGDVDITKADFLLAIGRGVEDADNVERFVELADKLGATLGVSRPLVDAGWVPSARQVGQSGKTVKPRVYMAMGISGAVQHLAGMRSAEVIIAVNTDPEAPIFSVAHYGAVTDMFELADALDRAVS